MSVTRVKILKPFRKKSRDYSLGVLIKFGKILKVLKIVTAGKPISKGVEWRLFEPHSLYKCRDSYG